MCCRLSTGGYLSRVAGSGVRDLTLSSSYGIYYPYQPPIQRTTDGNYVLPSDWSTLTEVSRPVEMDLSQQGTEFSHYEDNMRLVTGGFRPQMEVLDQKMQAAG